MAICICRYPLMIMDKREGSIGNGITEVPFIAVPIEIIKDRDMPIPDIEVVEETGFDGITRKYMEVDWDSKSMPKDGVTKRYNVNEHIVIAGCPKNQLECDVKAIYTVYHPMNEWLEHHIVELK